MATRVEMPPGCYGLEMPDGTKYDGRPGRAVHVDNPAHLAQIGKSFAGQHGVVGSTSVMVAVGTRVGRRCQGAGCGFLGQAWSMSCPRCGSNTREEIPL